MAITVIPSVERCSECFTTVQFEPSDVEVEDCNDYRNEYDSISIYYHYIVCPCCGAIIRLD